MCQQSDRVVGRDRLFPGGLQRDGGRRGWDWSLRDIRNMLIPPVGTDRPQEVRMSQTADSRSEAESSDVSM